MTDIVADESVDTTETDKIIMNIFALCDDDKTGMVTVSKLIDFISPYIDYNVVHLEELRSVLDPAKLNSCIDNETFFRAMKGWTDKFKNEFQTANASSDMVEPMTTNRLSDHLLRESTPMRETIGRCYSRNDYEAGILNMSNISSYSYSGSNAGGIDPAALQEQINELQYQNRNLNGILTDVRCQLNDSEEQNSSLKSDLERISKRLQAEQKVNEHLQKERKEHEEYRESTNTVLKKYETLSQNLTTFKKENTQLESQVDELQTENQCLQETITKLRCKDSERTSIENELKIEIEVHEKEISSLEECKRNLNEVCREKDELVQNLIDETQHLKYEKKTLEKRLHDVLMRNTAVFAPTSGVESGKSSFPFFNIHRQSTPIPCTPSYDTKFNSFNFDSPITRIFDNKGILNSPKLVKMLNNPISPIKSDTPMLRRNLKPQIARFRSEPFVSTESDLSPSIKSNILINIDSGHGTEISPILALENSLTICPETQYQNSPLNTSNPEYFSSTDIQLESTDNTHMPKSLSPTHSSDEDFYFRSPFNNFPAESQHESLHSELVHASATECIGTDFSCDHKQEIFQYEEEIESLMLELKQHEHCNEHTSKLQIELINTQKTLAKYEQDIETLKSELFHCKTELKKLGDTVVNEYINKLAELETKFKTMTTEKENRINELESSEDEWKIQSDKKNVEIVNLNDKVAALTQDITACKREIEIINTEKELTKTELKSILVDCAAYENKCKSLHTHLKTLEHELQVKEQDKVELLNTNRNIVEDLTTHKTNHIIAQQQITILNFDLTKTKKDLAATSTRLEDATQNYATLTLKYEIAENKLDDLNKMKQDICAEEYTKTQEELKTLKSVYNKSKSTLEWKIKHIHTLEAEIETITKENIGFENKLKNMDNLIVRNSSLEEQLEEYIVKYKCAMKQLPVIEEMRENYKKTQQKLKEKETQLKTKTKIIKDLSDKINTLTTCQDAEKNKFIQEHLELRNKIHEMTEQLTESQQKQDSLNAAMMELSEAGCHNCEKLQGELAALKHDAELVKTQLNALQVEEKPETKVEPKKRRVEVLHYKIDKLDEQLDEEKSKNKQLVLDLMNITAEKSGLVTRIEEVNKEKKDLVVQKEQCQFKIKKLLHTIDALELKLQTFRQDINDLKCEVENKNKEVKEYQKRMYEVEDKANELHSNHITLVAHVTVARQRLKDYRQNLGSNTLGTVNVWKATLETITPGSPILKLMDATLLDVTNMSTGGPLDEEVNLLNQQIRFTSILLKTLTKFKETIFAIGTENVYSNSNEKQRKSVTSNQSFLASVVTKKFTLKPATLTLRASGSKFSSMGPEFTAAEMAAVTSHTTKPFFSETELNNNVISNEEPSKTDVVATPAERKPFLSDGSESSSSSDSGSSDSLNTQTIRSSGNEVFRLSAGESKLENENTVKDGLARQFRSMSEGTVVTHQLTGDGDVQVFPNLRDNVLETMGLLPDSESKDRMTAEDIEVKFQTITLAFAIDAVTLADRLERQRRQRDQAEDNLTTEITKFANAIRRLHPLCIDAETTELVTSLLSQLDVIVQASSRISISAEVFGSVQQEWRLTESVNLMLSHLRNLRQQRDTARQQLQCTKRMLQESTCAGELTSPGSRQRLTSANGRLVTRRRASIATIQRPGESLRSPGSPTTAALVDGFMPRRVTTRRTSATVCGEVSYRHWDSRHRLDWNPTDRPSSIIRSTRPNRLELGLDLVKIREGTMEPLNSNDEINSDTEIDFQTPTNITEQTFAEGDLSVQGTILLRDRLRNKLHEWGDMIQQYWNYLVSEGTVHEFCCIGAIICFALSTITLGNIMIEMEYARQGVTVQKIPWSWVSWTEILAPFFQVLHREDPPPV